MLKIKNLSFGYFNSSNKYLIKNLNFLIKKGEIQLIFGKTGIGKSTLLNLITGFEDKKLTWTGQIFLKKRDMSNEPTEKLT